MSFLTGLVLKPLLPVLLAPAVFYAMKGLKVGIKWVGAQDPWVQRGIVVAVSALFSAVAKFVPGVGEAMPCIAAMSCSLADVTPEVVKILGTAGLAFLIHFNRKLPV
jgi:hypothetical protein